MIKAQFYPRKTDEFAPSAKTAVILTYILSFLGLALGIILLIYTIDIEPILIPEVDDLTQLGRFFRLIGIIFTAVALVSLIVNILFINQYRIGWFSLAGIYLAGTGISIYVTIRSFVVLTSYVVFAIPFHLFLIIGVGIVGLVCLFRRDTLRMFFKKEEIKIESITEED